MANQTHERACEWAAARLGAESVEGGAGYHLRASGGKRIRVAGRHIKGRQPNFFAVGDDLSGSPYDEHVVVLFNRDWSIQYAYKLPLAAVRTHHRQPGSQGCRLMIRGDDSWRQDPRVVSLD